MYTVSTFGRFVLRIRQYIDSGYIHYRLGSIPAQKDPTKTDRKLIDQYNITRCRTTRHNRRKAGKTVVVYLRYGQQFILMAQEGETDPDSFFEMENPLNCGTAPIRVNSYTLGIKGDRPHIQLVEPRYKAIRKKAIAIALKSITTIKRFFAENRYIRFQGVLEQKRKIVRAMNQRRRSAGLSPLSVDDMWLGHFYY